MTVASFFATVAAIAVPAALLAIVPAQSAMAATRTMTGTIDGSDGRAVNALIAFDIHRKNGTKIDLNGGGGYSATISVNRQVPVTGATKGPGKTTTWSLTMPSDAAYVYIEAYGKSPHASGNPSMQGPTSQYRYGFALRRAWSTATDSAASRKILGWNTGSGLPSDRLLQGYYNFVINNLASEQGYTVWVTVGSRTITKKVGSIATCKGAVVNFSF